MDLQTLQWPRASQLIRQEGQTLGFGGGFLSSRGTAQYQVLDNSQAVQNEVKKVEEIQGDPPAETDKEQHVLEPPPQVEEALEQAVAQQQQQRKRPADQGTTAGGEGGARHKHSKKKTRLF